MLSVVARAEQHLSSEFRDVDDRWWEQLAGMPAQHVARSIQASCPTGLLDLTAAATHRLPSLTVIGNDATVAAVLGRSRIASVEVLPPLQRLLSCSNERTATMASLLVAEVRGFSPEVIPGVIQSLTSADDLTRHRAAEVLYGGPSEEPMHYASVATRLGLDMLFTPRSGPTFSRAVRNGVTWFCQRLLHDSVPIIEEWASELGRNATEAAARRGLSSIQHVGEGIWETVFSKLKIGPTVVRKALLTSMANLAHLDRLGQGNWDVLRASMREVDDPGLEAADISAIELDQLCKFAIDQLADLPEDICDAVGISAVRNKFTSDFTLSWASIFRIEPPAAGFARLKAVGRSTFATKTDEFERWAEATEVAKPGVEHVGFLELLCEWAVAALSDSASGNDVVSSERSYVIELLAGATTIAPARFLRSPSLGRLRTLLLHAAVHETSYVARSDSVRLIGFTRHFTADVVPVLKAALADVEAVGDAANEAVNLFRRMDIDVLPEIRSWLADESGLVAFAAARCLATIGRHVQVTGKLDRTASKFRREIVDALAAAVRSPVTDRSLDFGIAAVPVPFVPRLCDFIFDALLTVAGYEM